MVLYIAGPHEALIKSTRGKAPQVVIGGRCIAIPGLHELSRLSLHLRTIIVRSENAITKNRVNMCIVSCCQVKVQAWVKSEDGSPKVDKASVRLAAQHFLGRTEEQIDSSIRDTLEGHQRAIVSQLTVEELYASRASFVEEVRTNADPDLARMGVAMVSYVVQTLSDDSEYMTSLGAEPVAKMMRSAMEASSAREAAADVVVAGAESDAKEVQAYERQRMTESRGARLVYRQNAKADVERKQAVATSAYSIEDARQARELAFRTQRANASEQREANVVEVAILERERLRQQATRKVESDAALYMRRAEAEAEKVRARAEAECIRIIGDAEASTADVALDIEADRVERKVQIMNKVTNDAFLAAYAIEQMPSVVRAQVSTMGASEMTFVSRTDHTSTDAPPHRETPEQQESDGGGIEFRELRAGADADAEIDITRALSNASSSVPGRVTAAAIAARALRNRFRTGSCFRR